MELTKVLATPGLCEEFKPTLSPVVEMLAPHTDVRGQILPLVDENMRSAVIIVSCGGAWKGADQTLAWCGECCGLPIPYCRHCAYSAGYAHQISLKVEQKRSLTRMQ